MLKNKKYYIYQIWEMIRANIGDDDSLDERLIGAWLDGARSIWLTNELNKGNVNRQCEQVLGTNGYVSLQLVDIAAPLSTTVPVKVTTISIPKTIETEKMSTLIVTSPDFSSKAYKLIKIDDLRYIGNSRFNKEAIVCFRLEDKVYMFCPDPNNHEFKLLNKIKIRGYFDDPSSVIGFNEETDEYPISERLFSYLKNEIVKNNYKFEVEKLDDIHNNSDKS